MRAIVGDLDDPTEEESALFEASGLDLDVFVQAADEGLPPGWTKQSECSGVDADLFFPERGESPYPAKKICVGCPVRGFCLIDSLIHRDLHGVWGGTSEKERRALRKALRRLGVIFPKTPRNGILELIEPDFDDGSGTDEDTDELDEARSAAA